VGSRKYFNLERRRGNKKIVKVIFQVSFNFLLRAVYPLAVCSETSLFHFTESNARRESQHEEAPFRGPRKRARQARAPRGAAGEPSPSLRASLAFATLLSRCLKDGAQTGGPAIPPVPRLWPRHCWLSQGQPACCGARPAEGMAVALNKPADCTQKAAAPCSAGCCR